MYSSDDNYFILVSSVPLVHDYSARQKLKETNYPSLTGQRFTGLTAHCQV